MQAGMHLGMEGFFGSALKDAVDESEASALRTRSPEKFAEGMRQIFEGSQSLQIPAEEFSNYFREKGLDPAQVAAGLGSTNYAEAVLSGGNVEVPPAEFLSQLDPEHQKALLQDVIDPSNGMSMRQVQQAHEELQTWMTEGGPAKLAQEFAAADQETQASPEYQELKTGIRQQYIDAGETETAADSQATLDANVYTNLARQSGLTPAELLRMYPRNVKAVEAPEAAEESPRLYQDAIENIRSVVDAAKQPGHASQKAVIAPVDDWLAKAAKEHGLDIEGHKHVIDGSAVRHVVNRHGNEKIEVSRGQLPVTAADFDRIPQVISEPDQVVLGTKTKGRRDQIGYMKRLEDGTILYLEEVRTGKKELATVSMRKYPATRDFDAIAGTLPSNARSDGGNNYIVVQPPKANKSDTFYQTAYHGSPYAFDHFSLDHVGNGEGNQSYGWGLYFAGNEKVAEYYRESLSSALRMEGYLDEDNLGQMYKVDVPEDDQLLSWDKSLIEQPEPVQSALSVLHKHLTGDLLDDYLDRMNAEWNELSGRELYRLIKRGAEDDILTDKQGDQVSDDHPIGDALVRGRFDEAASLFLNEHGIKGIRYLDSNSRAGAEGHHNYVVFDDNAIKLLQRREYRVTTLEPGETLYQSGPGEDEPPVPKRAAAPAGTKGAVRGWFRVLPDGSFEIAKTQSGDLSTFLHETSHSYLQMLSELSKREGASETLKSDYETILKFLRAKDGEPLTRSQQELWARANEMYLREGRSPTNALREVFQRFAAWLGNIYRNARQLGVELDPEIRGVLDRLYQGEEAVNRAEQEAGPALFTDAEQAGWTDEEYQRYADDHGIAFEHAKEEVLKQLNAAAERERTDSWREEKRNVMQALTEQIDARPEYVAIRSLRRGKLDDGTELTLNREDLVRQF